jgi:hypothetical protein
MGSDWATACTSEPPRSAIDDITRACELLKSMKPTTSPDKLFITNEAWSKLEPHIGIGSVQGGIYAFRGLQVFRFEDRFKLVGEANKYKDNLGSIIAVDVDENGWLCELNLAGYLGLLDGFQIAAMRTESNSKGGE